MSYFNFINELLQDYQNQIMTEFRELRTSGMIKEGIEGAKELNDAQKRAVARQKEDDCTIF